MLAFGSEEIGVWGEGGMMFTQPLQPDKAGSSVQTTADPVGAKQLLPVCWY